MKRRVARAGALPIRRVERDPDAELADGEWPVTIPAIGQLLRDGLDLSPVTVLIGANGSGKSTIVEGIAGAYGMSPRFRTPGLWCSTTAAFWPSRCATCGT